MEKCDYSDEEMELYPQSRVTGPGDDESQPASVAASTSEQVHQQGQHETDDHHRGKGNKDNALFRLDPDISG